MNSRSEKRISEIMEYYNNYISTHEYKIPRLKRKTINRRGRARRPIIGVYENESVEFKSILECSFELKTDTSTLRRYIENHKPLCGYLLHYKDVVMNDCKQITNNNAI